MSSPPATQLLTTTVGSLASKVTGSSSAVAMNSFTLSWSKGNERHSKFTYVIITINSRVFGLTCLTICCASSKSGMNPNCWFGRLLGVVYVSLFHTLYVMKTRLPCILWRQGEWTFVIRRWMNFCHRVCRKSWCVCVFTLSKWQFWPSMLKVTLCSGEMLNGEVKFASIQIKRGSRTNNLKGSLNIEGQIVISSLQKGAHQLWWQTRGCIAHMLPAGE